MDVRIVINPELDLDADDIIAAWNANPDTRAQAEAQVGATSQEAFLGPGTAMIVLGVVGGVVGLAALDILKEAVKKILVDKLTEKPEHKDAPPELSIEWVDQDGGKLLVISEAK